MLCYILSDLGKRATTDIKHVLNLGWYQAVTANTQKRVAMDVDIQQQLREYARQSMEYMNIIVYTLWL